MNPQDRIAQLDASVAALWARMNNISNAGGQVVIIGGSGGTGAPSAAQYLVLAADAGLGVERIWTPGSGLGAVDSGAGAAYTVSLGTLTADWNTVGIFNINHDGHISIGAAATPDASRILVVSENFDGSTTQRAVNGTITAALTGDQAGPVIGLDYLAACSGGHNLTGTPGLVVVRGGLTTLSSSTVVTDARIFNSNVVGIGSGSTVTTLYHVYLKDASGAGSLTNQYGLYIENMAKGGTLNRAIYSAGGISVHAGAIAIGSTTAPVASALTEWTSTTQGLKPPNMTTTQRDAIGTPATSLLIYNTTTNTYDYYDGTAWRQIDISDGNKIDIVSTTDATVTTLATVTIPATTTVQIEARVSARRTGGSGGTAEDGAAYVRRAAIKNVAGTATIIGAVGTDFTAEDQAGWDCTIDVTAATARVRVTGATNNNINWKSEVRTLNVS